MKSRLVVAVLILLAATVARQAVAQTPQEQRSGDDSSLSPRDQTMERARYLMVQKRYEEGIQAYQEVLKNEPKNAIVLNFIGIGYLNLGNFGQAKKYFERSAKMDKKYFSAVNNLGMVYYQQKNYRRAIRQYQKAVAMQDIAGLHVNLGFAYYRVQKYPEAAKEFRAALQLDPHALDQNQRGGSGSITEDRSVENHGLFFFMMAREYAQLGKPEECAAYLRKSLDEGYKDVVKAKTDPAFKKVLDDPAMQEVLALMVPADSKPGAAQPGT